VRTTFVTTRRPFLIALAVAAALIALQVTPDAQQPRFRLAIAGLVHGHVDGFLRGATSRPDVEIVGIQDPDPALRQKYADKYKLDPAILHADLASLLERSHPDAVASFTSTADHPAVVEAAAARRITVMMEKPLAVSVADGERIRNAAAAGGIDVLVNYETTWYESHAAIWRTFKETSEHGAIRRIVAMDGHAGPKAINVQPEFFTWLTDAVANGAGALFDFGCYGANLMTWLMDGARPVAVTAVTQRLQPAVYPRVDDEATIVIEYPGAVGIVEASWNWPFNRKDLEVYAERASAVATGGKSLRVTLPKAPPADVALTPLPPDEADSISHLMAVARKQRRPNALSSLDNNLVVTAILEAARESAQSHRRVELKR
jgi:scyllo-inositol 2-dehydrogenase (NADP+)